MHRSLDDETRDHEKNADADRDDLADAEEWQIKTGMRKQLAEQAQIGKYERLAQRLVLRVADCGDETDERKRRAGRKQRPAGGGEHEVEYEEYGNNMKH
ncbi:hypothetical protein VTA46_04695 [Burkholderia cenocepacia]|nr:hypothetical protein [Burkholderia cenocepacia]MEC4769954.1 hypothetical protein [Burkholderia cenocepacia]